MECFVFRNNTIERFFPKEYAFSGYDDISFIPDDAKSFLWFYQAPIKFDLSTAASEIDSFAEKFLFVVNQIGNKSIVALTMAPIYSVQFTEDSCQLKNAIIAYNNTLYRVAQEKSNVKVIDITEFYKNYPAQDLIDWKFYFISQMGLNPKLTKPFMAWFQRKMESLALKRKKCLVLDLDNTLWGGILGEDGIDGIKIGGDYPGKAYLYFQEALLELSKSGVILTICSKNNEADVLDAWEKNPFIRLKKDSFSAYRINWTDKATNIKELADELNIGLDSFVFVDDNPTERELVKQSLPMVAVPDFPEQPYELPQFFAKLVRDYFEVYSITDEDKKKTEQYKANASRMQAQKSFGDFNSFLKSLDMHVVIEKANVLNIPRIAQMTQKTNQFNLTTKRYTDADIRNFEAKGANVYCLSVSDKFGDSGITGCIIVDGDSIDSLLLSCRILGKGIELAFVKTVLGILKQKGISKLSARYIPTAKNAQVKDFYEKCGFVCVAENEDGSKAYRAEFAQMDFNVEDFYNVEVK